MKRAVARSTRRARGIFGFERPVEAREVLHLGDGGLFQPPRKETIGPPGELVLHEQIEKVQVRQRGGGRLLEAQGQRLGHAGEP
jgi:hypothetical protein